MSKKRRVMGQSFEMLPVEERAQQYREMADATFLKAQKVKDAHLREQYLSMASSWHALAQELEKGNPDLEVIPGARPMSPDDTAEGSKTPS